ncbi:MAG TPA: alpha/beta hydrolase [Caulobacteraceae bacterium]|jgi:pimeloyl-ACP methyl ester carboxylesterase|nr:alpha/beta hydrolase [Caulobacteraceae bacterium]
MADAPFQPWAEVEPPLVAFKGEAPPAPDWFKWAIAQEPERSNIPVLGANIELLTWGELGKPGLILMHGNSAHADWWSFIAPYLALDYRVAAISFSGMGASDWRDAYSFATFAAEAHAGAEAAGLYQGPVKPVFIGHSFGGAQVFYQAMNHPDWMRGAILVDTGFGGPPPASEGFRQPQMRTQPNRVYPTLEGALGRFRFMPPQGCPNLYIADFIARRSLKRAPLPEGEGKGGGEGWTWRFDPLLWSKLDQTALESIVGSKSDAPLVHIHGQNSKIMERQAQQLDLLPARTKRIVIPDSEHHIMVDQPLALVSALRAVLACWP